MKAAIALKRLVTGIGLFLLCCGAAGAAEPFTAFGLQHSLLTNTVLTTGESPGLRIENVSRLCPEEPCDFLDGFGVTVHLGEAESGLFAYPDDAGALYEAYLVDIEFSGYRLEGLAYGSVDGLTNRSISSLWVTRVGWGQYMMSVDFTPLGATGYTYEVFSDGHRTLVATNRA